MSAPEFVSEANRWLRFAAEDLNVAQNLLASNESAPRHMCAQTFSGGTLPQPVSADWGFLFLPDPTDFLW